MQLVYKEQNEKVFYDAMAFWNDEEGMAIGDPVENCMSIIGFIHIESTVIATLQKNERGFLNVPG